MAIYSGTISKDVVLQAGPRQLSLKFQWPEVIQEQYDKYIALITTRRDSDPLVNTNGDRDTAYDFLGFYLSLPEDLEEWLNTSPSLPQSILKYTQEQQIAEIQERIRDCHDIKTIIDNFQDILVWQVTINETTTLLLRCGGWTTGPDGDWKIQFISDREVIGKNDLEYVTVRVEV